ncbi:MAG TPA: selenoneine synthase SenA [Burkholderiaceae bacterium]
MLNESSAATSARCADAAALSAALSDTRRCTLSAFDAYERALGSTGFIVPYSPQLNPPLWELGHVGWFQEWWLSRNPQRHRGTAADPDAPRPAPHRAGDDALFDSSRVAHTDRWRLPLPTANALRDGLAAGLQESLALLRDGSDGDDALYFFRLCLFHEDMHHEASIYMAQHLGIPLAGWSPRPHGPTAQADVAACVHALGAPLEGFAFDNELARHEVSLDGFCLDTAPVTWGAYLRFVEAGGYRRRAYWSEPGWAWLQSQGLQAPRYLRTTGSVWRRQTFGRWLDVDAGLAAMNLSCFEAQAYCAWAARRLSSEAEWECAAEQLGSDFEWGQAWEWTASAFAPYPGFAAHPYRDYSAPWFHTRQVLRGGSFATHPRIKHAGYRNFFEPGRNDVHAGFRTCALREPETQAG